jgi:hypothetical protein
MRSKVSQGEYLAFLCLKYDVDPEEFFNALISAKENKNQHVETSPLNVVGKK